jgi:hypothetical protein
MLPRRSEDSAGDAERATSALSPLPLALVLYIFSLLPVDCRLRCMEVCRGWRSVLLERSVWTRLELTAASGVQLRAAPVGTAPWDGLLRCAAARAGGGLHSLRIDGVSFSHAALLDAAAANAGALRELHVHAGRAWGYPVGEAEEVLAAAPQLRVFHAHVSADDVAAVRRALRNEAPFGPLRMLQLDAFLGGYNVVDEADVVAFAADVAAHASLARLTLHAPLDTPAALDAVVDAALARRMHTVALLSCDLSPASSPALARLLAGGTLTELLCMDSYVLDAPGARVLAAALRANATLTWLTLGNVGVFYDAAPSAELFGALIGHASLRVLCLKGNGVHAVSQATSGGLLGALVAANAPALTELDVSSCNLGDDGLLPLFEALSHNTHLRRVDCYANGMSDAYARDVLGSARLCFVKAFMHAAEVERFVQFCAAV